MPQAIRCSRGLRHPSSNQPSESGLTSIGASGSTANFPLGGLYLGRSLSRVSRSRSETEAYALTSLQPARVGGFSISVVGVHATPRQRTRGQSSPYYRGYASAKTRPVAAVLPALPPQAKPHRHEGAGAVLDCHPASYADLSAFRYAVADARLVGDVRGVSARAAPVRAAAKRRVAHDLPPMFVPLVMLVQQVREVDRGASQFRALVACSPASCVAWLGCRSACTAPRLRQ